MPRLLTGLAGTSLTALAATIAVAPVVYALNRPGWLLGATGLTALFFIVAFWGDRQHPRVSARGLWAVVPLTLSPLGTAALLILVCYGIGRGAGLAIEALWRFFAEPPAISTTLAETLGVMASFVFGLGSLAVTVAVVVRWLAVSAEAGSSIDDPTLVDRPHAFRFGVLAFVFAGTAVTFALTGRGGRTVPAVLLQVALIYAAMPIWTSIRAVLQRSRTTSWTHVLHKLLVVAGFAIDERRQSADPLAPLLEGVEVVARRDRQRLVLAIHGGTDERERRGWKVASALGLAASALAVEEELPREAVHALLVVIGDDANPSLLRAATAERVGLLRATRRDLAAAGRGDGEALSALLARLEAALGEVKAAST